MHPAITESTIVSHIQSGLARLRAIAQRAWIIRALQQVVAGFIGGSKTYVPSSIQAAVTHSRLFGVYSMPSAGFNQASARSQLIKLVSRGRLLITHSWLYRWLTAEPEPDVIVIDLRETLSVGPILRLLEQAINRVVPAAVSSVVGQVLSRGYQTFISRPIQVLGVLLLSLTAIAFLAILALGEMSIVAGFTILALCVIAAVACRITWSVEKLTTTRGYEFLASVFQPPSSPEQVSNNKDAKENGESTTD